METGGSPQFPRSPWACLPRSQTPVVSCALAIAHAGLLPSGAWQPSAFPSMTTGGISSLSTTLPIAGLHHAACILVPSSVVRPLLGVHVDCAPDRLARLWSGGTCTCCAHPLGNNNPFHEIALNPKVSGLPWRDQALVRLGLCVWMPLILYPALSPLRSRIKNSRGHPTYCLARGDRAANASSTTCSLICSMPNPARVAANT